MYYVHVCMYAIYVCLCTKGIRTYPINTFISTTNQITFSTTTQLKPYNTIYRKSYYYRLTTVQLVNEIFRLI